MKSLCDGDVWSVFVVLLPQRCGDAGILGKVRSILIRPKVHMESRRIAGGSYTILRADIRHGRFDWDAVLEYCGRFADRLLIPDGIQPPEGYRQPVLASFKKQVLLETACEIIERAGCPMYRRVVGLIDEEARHADMLAELLKYYTCVKVVTRRPERYVPESEKMMRELGAPVLISTEVSGVSDCVVVLSPGGLWTGIRKLPGIVLSCDGIPQGFCGDFVTKLQIAPPAEILKETPEGIDPQEFAGALYEYSGVRGIRMVADKMLWNNRLVSLTELVHTVAAFAKIPEFKYW